MAATLAACDSLGPGQKSIILLLKPELELPSRKRKILRNALRERANFALATSTKNYGDRSIQYINTVVYL